MDEQGLGCVMLNEDGLLCILPGHFRAGTQRDQDFRKEKTEEEIRDGA